MNSIETHNLTKHFGAGSRIVESVRGVDIAVRRGEIFGFLGPNGAGKTTTMRMLTTLLEPTDGTALIDDIDVRKDPYAVRRRIGYVSQTGGLDRHATARENLFLQARIFGLSKKQATQRTEELIQLFDLKEYADRFVGTFSGGQRRRVDIALSMVHRPSVLFLDEPSTGLDPQSRACIWHEIKKVRDMGTTLFLTSHYLDEVDALCDRIAIMDHGKIVAEGTSTVLKQQIARDVVIVGFAQVEHKQQAQTLLQAQEAVQSVVQENDTFLRLYVDQGDAFLPYLLRTLDHAQLNISTISLTRPTLDDVFLQQTGRSWNTAQQREK